MIPYTPEELVAIAEKELAWCEAEMSKAARDLGFGDDWKKALEQVKTRYVEPGKQPALIRDLALEAIDFLEKRDLVTIPPLAKETWRMEMMSPQRQLVNPFFTGRRGHQRLVPDRRDDPRAEADEHARQQRPLLPGHRPPRADPRPPPPGFMAARHRAYRRAFSTPFSVEGWALYWELRLWDLGFARSPEDRVGMLFWRMHRCARIIFSLNFHLGKMTPEECIDLLVDRVGHERANAAGEVRRSFDGDYSPALPGGLPAGRPPAPGAPRRAGRARAR